MSVKGFTSSCTHTSWKYIDVKYAALFFAIIVNIVNNVCNSMIHNFENFVLIKLFTKCLVFFVNIFHLTKLLILWFHEILRRSWGPKSKNTFIGIKIRWPPPPILPQLFTPVMHFQWEGPNTAVTRPVDRLWRLRAQMTFLGSGYKHKVAKCCKPQFCP